jgi:hypothetical protein
MLLTPDIVKEIENEIYELLKIDVKSKVPRLNLYNYIIDNGSDTIVQYEGEDSFKIKRSYEIKLPSELVKLRNFTYNDYPLNDNKTMFKDNKPYDYLTTFSYNSFKTNEALKDDIRYKGIESLLDMQAQTRFGDIWRQLAGVLWAVDKLDITQEYGKQYPLRNAVKLLLSKYGQFPFIDRRGRIEGVTDDIPSILPLLVYMLISIGTDLCIGVINHIESGILIMNYFTMARKGYQDEKLKLKSKYRNFLNEGFNNLKRGLIPLWSITGTIVKSYVKEFTEPTRLNDQIEEAKEERKKLPKDIYNYIESVLKIIKTQDDLKKLYLICMAASNDRTYYSTLMELGLDAGILPKSREIPVITPKPTLTEVESNYTYGLDYDSEEEGHVARVSKYLEVYERPIADELHNLNMDKEWTNFVTTKSSGKDLEETVKSQYSKKVRKITGKRVVDEAIEASKYRHLARMEEGRSNMTRIGSRTQIDRRFRGIANMTNAQLFTTLPFLQLTKPYAEFNPDPAQGKQTGSSVDIMDHLAFSSKNDVLLSSLDVSAMDATVQIAVTNIFNKFALGISKNLGDSTYGPWSTKNITLTDVEGEMISEKHNGVTQCVVYNMNAMQTSTTFDSYMFGQINNAEGTYPSGIAPTSIHHTVLLSASTRANELNWNNVMKKYSSIAYVLTLGDDKLIVYKDEPNKAYNQAESDAEALRSLGFKTTLEVSRNACVFLQQMIVNGTYWGFPSRVTFCTREKQKERRSLSDNTKELLSIMDDMNSRCYDIHGLLILVYGISFFCLSRYTISIEKEYIERFIAVASKYVKYQLYERDKYSNSLITMYIPLVWFFMYKGGELPAPGFQRRDGSYTLEQSIFSARGEFKRRLLYDITNIRELCVQGKIYLDNDLLNSYGFNNAGWLIEMNILEMIKNVRENTIDGGEIAQIALGLESIGDFKARDNSKKAWYELRVEGLEIGKDIAYGFNIQTKIRQLLLVEEEDTYEMKVISKELTKTAEKLKNYELTIEGNDYKHLYYMNHSDVKLEYIDAAKYITKVSLANNMSPYTYPWLLYIILGGVDVVGGGIKVAIANVKGLFQSFKGDDPVFQAGLRLYKDKTKKYLLDKFYIMINASERERALYEKQFENYIRTHSIIYNYISTPRMFFFISDNPMSILRSNNISMNEEMEVIGSNESYALMATYGYLLLTSCPQIIKGYKFKMNFHQLIINNLKTLSVR